MSTNVTCGQAVPMLLEAYGVDTVFGIPGVHTLELYKGMTETSIRHVQTRHEQGAGFMADGYARVSGRPGVCLLITGPGVTNAATAMGQAFSDSIPMLVVSSTNATADIGMGRGRLHEITSQDAVTAPLTAFSRTAPSAADVPNLMARAFAVFENERPRPVHISLPLDVLDAPGDFDRTPRVPSAPPAPAAQSVEAAVAILAGAKRPVIIAGGGTVACAAAVTALAEKLGAAVLPTIAGKGVVPDDHPLCLGANLSNKPAQEFLATADVVVAIGTELAETDFWIDRAPINGKLIRIDIDASSTQRDYPAAAAMIGDAGQAVEAILARLDGAAGPGFADGELSAVRDALAAFIPPLDRIHGQVLDALRAALRSDPDFKAVLVTHNETSTGVANDLETIGAIVKGEFDKLLLVDGISSVGSLPLRTDAWGCHVVTSASQKGWMLPPGLAFISFSQRAWEAHAQATMPRFYFDLAEYRAYFEKGQPPWTPAISVMFALDLALEKIVEEGIDNVYVRHAEIGRFTRDGVRRLGLTLLPDEAVASNSVTAVNVPEGVDVKELLALLRQDHDIVLAAGQESLSDKIFRIGHMGQTTHAEIQDVFDALAVALPKVGFEPVRMRVG